MRNHFSVLLLVALVLPIAQARADGSPDDYSRAIVNQMSLDPNESTVLDDGRTEDPNARMSTTARAFVNGVYNGRQMQKDQDAQVNVPPLPPMPVQPKGYTGYPPAAQVQAIPQPPQQQYVQREYVQPPQQYRQPPQPPVVVNVNPDPRYYEPADQYGRAPSWRNRMEAQQMYDESASAYAGPDGVYANAGGVVAMVPSQSAYAAPLPPPAYYVPPPPVVYVQPGYVRRIAPVPMYGYPYGGYGGISARIGHVRIGIGGYGY